LSLSAVFLLNGEEEALRTDYGLWLNMMVLFWWIKKYYYI